MSIASPSAPSFCCTTRSGSTNRRLAQSIPKRAGSNRTPRVTAQLNASSDGEVVYELNYNRHPRGRGAFPVYVSLPPDAVGPAAQTMRRRRAMAQSFRALAAAGVEGLVMEVWWGLVESEFPGKYNWQGYLEIVEMAKRFGLKIRAVMAFHQCGLGPHDPFWLGIQVGLGPGGELRYPSSPTQKLTLPSLGEFQCYDKYMLASLYASTRELSLMQNLDNTDFFLRWYSKTLLLHGERICREAETIFRGNKVNMSGKVAGPHWHHDTAVRDGFVPAVRMFGRYGFTVCCTCFEMRDDEMNRAGRPESLLKQLMLAARICDVPLEGENYSTGLNDESFGQILKMSKFYSDGLKTPSFSFNFVRMDKNLFEPRNWVSFSRFVRRVSEMNMFRAGVGFEGGNGNNSPPVAAFAGAVLAY